MSLPADTDAYMLHRLPLRLVRQLLCVEDNYAEAEATINVGEVGVDPEGKVEAAVLLELVAQTYAAAHGYQDQLANRPANIGYLAGVGDFEVQCLPSAGQQLLIKVKSSRLFGDFYLVDGQVFCEGCVVAGGTLRVWVQPETRQQAQ
jgi:predicted hotdog family 3-hydroxylacyl-ACP dehydratase